MDLGDRLVAEAALGGVDDPLEGEVVGRLGDDAQVSERVADLGPLVESEAADDPVGQADGDEAVLELAGLELGPDEDRGLVDPAAAALDAFDLLADPAGFLRSEGEVVGRLGDDAQVSERVADLGPLVESEAADDPVGQADGDEAVLELAGLELGPDEDRGLVDPAAAALDAFDLLADPAGFL